MNINIDYTGTLGTGTTSIEIVANATIEALLTAFHTAIAVDDFYTIQGGAPPNRRSMKVRYDYYINNRLVKDVHALITTLKITTSENITLLIDKGLRVD